VVRRVDVMGVGDGRGRFSDVVMMEAIKLCVMNDCSDEMNQQCDLCLN
jgi:hypothetical protein